jgi:hypothetical protein
MARLPQITMSLAALLFVLTFSQAFSLVCFAACRSFCNQSNAESRHCVNDDDVDPVNVGNSHTDISSV